MECKLSNTTSREVDIDDLILRKVDLPIDATLEQTLESLGLHPKNSLLPVATLLQVFSVFPDKNHLHIVVLCGNEEAPANEEVSANVEHSAVAMMDFRGEATPVRLE